MISPSCRIEKYESNWIILPGGSRPRPQQLASGLLGCFLSRCLIEHEVGGFRTRGRRILPHLPPAALRAACLRAIMPFSFEEYTHLVGGILGCALECVKDAGLDLCVQCGRRVHSVLKHELQERFDRCAIIRPYLNVKICIDHEPFVCSG